MKEGFEITGVSIMLVDDPLGKLLAYASITICDAFVVKSVKVINGTNGVFVAMPSRPAHDGSHRDIAHPLNQATRDYVEAAVLDVYKQTLEQGQPAS